MPTFRVSDMVSYGQDLLISGVLHQGWADNGSGANFYVILRYHAGTLSLVTIGRGLDTIPATINDWELDQQSGIIYANGVYLYDYLGATWTQPQMAVVGTNLYFVHSRYDGRNGLNGEALAKIDLSKSDYPVTELISGYGFDYMSKAYTRGDYWQGNGRSYTVIPAADEKTITIVDGNMNEYVVDVARKSIKRVGYWYSDNPYKIGDPTFYPLSRGKVYNDKIYTMNAAGIYVQSKPTERPKLTFNPREMRWATGLPTAIADWDFVDDKTIAILDYDNHRVVRVKVTWG
ncbi:hypothetical protein [Cohnella soli]|uniref:Uncharacterized protein n=1 Tax=Cohnella soli TaxID=425005 RepID=A0ABW0HVY0_9BACL